MRNDRPSPEYAKLLVRNDPLFEPWSGVFSLLFGVGAAGGRVLQRLAWGEWFSGLRPTQKDLAASGGQAEGRWTVRAGPDAEDAPAVMAEQLRQAALPSAYVALIMVPHGADPGDQAATLALVAALRGRRGPQGGRVRILVTVGDAAAQTSTFMQKLAALGAFVMRRGQGTGGGAFHLYPLRTFTYPMVPRLVCVDFADCMQTWRPGWIGVLHTMPAEKAVVAPFAARMAGALQSAAGLNVFVQPDPWDFTLLEFDWLTNAICEKVGKDTVTICGESDRPDACIGLVDVLIIRDGAN